MNTEELERQLRSALRTTLDNELGPDPTWSESPAARRVAQLAHTRRRWPLRVLAIAALLGVGGGAALLAGTPNEPREAANGWIAFTVEQEEPGGVGPDSDIWLVALDQEPRRVIGTDTDGVDQLCPAFAPDGQSLAYGRVEGDDAGVRPAYRHSALVIADVADDGTVSDRLTVDVGDELPPPCPVWSPAGDQLAFGVPRTSPINPDRSGEGSEVWIVRLADRGVTVIPDVLATDLDWSPEGSVLAIAGGVETASGDGVVDGLQDARIHLYEPLSGTMRSLNDTLGVSHLTWSPDGGRIAYATIAHSTGDFESDFENELRVVDIETEEQEVLAAGYRALHGIGPVWSPDGETILYQRMEGPLRTGEAHEVVLVRPGDRSEETGPTNEVVIPIDRTTADGSRLELLPWRVTWSPDGTHLLYVAWSFGGRGCCDDSTVELTLLVAVPTNLDEPPVILAESDGIVAKDGYHNTTFVPIQTWGHRTTPSASSSTDEAATPTSAPTDEPSPVAGDEPDPFAFWQGSETQGPPITVTLPGPGWYREPGGGILIKGENDSPDGLGLIGPAVGDIYVPSDPCRWSTTMPDTPATTVDAVVAALQAQASRDASEPVDITVDGHAGQSITLQVPDDADIGECDRTHFCTLSEHNPAAECFRYAQFPGQIEEVWIVDVNGEVIVIVAMYGDATSAEDLAELQAIRDSMTFEEP